MLGEQVSEMLSMHKHQSADQLKAYPKTTNLAKMS